MVTVAMRFIVLAGLLSACTTGSPDFAVFLSPSSARGLRLDGTNAAFVTLSDTQSIAIGIDRVDGLLGFRLVAPLPHQTFDTTLTFWQPPKGMDEVAKSPVAVTWEKYAADELWTLHVTAVSVAGDPFAFDMQIAAANANKTVDFN
jgi:hypothetical protein